MNDQKRAIASLVAASGLALAATQASATSTIDISADTTQAKTDINTAGALIIGVIVAIAVIAWIRRVVH